MFDFLNIFGKNEKKSRDVAHDRLKFVLIHDRANVSPEVMERMREDIIQVISKYMDIDLKSMELSLADDNDSNQVALVANIPVRNIRYPGNNRRQ